MDITDLATKILAENPLPGEQGSPEWHAKRCGKVTASRIADVLAKGKGVSVKDGAVRGKLPPRSWHMLRIGV